MEKGIYENGLKQGKWTEYHINGKIQSEINFKDDKKGGVSKVYFDNGQLKREILYGNIDKEELCLEIISSFDENGKPFFIGTLKKGNGSLHEYEYGVFQRSRRYKNGKIVDTYFDKQLLNKDLKKLK